jgi:isopenicillin N synthase-like dioxygenase
MNQQEIVKRIFDISEKPIQEWIADYLKKSTDEIFDSPVQTQEKIQIVNSAAPTECYFISLALRDERKQNDADITVFKEQNINFIKVVEAFNSSVQVVTSATLRADGIKCSGPELASLQSLTWTYVDELYMWRSNLGGKNICMVTERMSQQQVDQILGVASIGAPAFMEVP